MNSAPPMPRGQFKNLKALEYISPLTMASSAPPKASRWLLFLLGCIGVRLVFVIIARFANPQTLSYLGYLALVPALGMLYLWLTNSRMTGMEAGGKIWWHSWRIVHASLYLAFAYSAITRDRDAYLYLAADVILALLLFFSHYGYGYLN